MSDWIEWRGGDQPVSDGTLVLYRMLNGDEGEDNAEWVRWKHIGHFSDIIAYRLVNNAQSGS
jgi:hypothetical protein